MTDNMPPLDYHAKWDGDFVRAYARAYAAQSYNTGFVAGQRYAEQQTAELRAQLDSVNRWIIENAADRL